MARSDWNERAVFLEALARRPDEREDFLKTACPDDAARERIRTLLRHQAEAPDDFLQVSAGRDETAAVPSQIEEFKILARIGEGGMGVVYLAEDTILGRRVALKVLARHMIGSEQALARFREEARLAAQLKHPAIVPVFRFGSAGGDYYLVSELVEGQTLADLIARRRSSIESQTGSETGEWHRHCAEIVATIADALESAHRAGIVHRDVKPSNILLDRERGPRLTDFGIAKHLTEENRTRHTGVLGTCHYMSPEQAAIAEVQVDHRSDIFSLGVVLYELLALRRPFDGKTVQQVLKAVVESDPPRLRTIDPRISADLETICHKAIEKTPHDRYQTAAHVAADLRCYLRGDPVLAKPPTLVRRARSWLRKRYSHAIGGFLAAALLAVGMWAWQLDRRSEASMAWVAVDSNEPRCTVYVQPVDPSSFAIQSPARRIGATPIAKLLLQHGQYRITVVSADRSAFLEFDAVLLDATPRKITRLQVLRAAAASDGTSWPDGEGSILAGRLAAPSDLRGMIRVDAETYSYGKPDYQSPESRPRQVALPGFYIDEQEVTNAAYKKFIDSTGHRQPSHWREFGYDLALTNRPVVEVTLQDAEAYARWRGARLPTALEWQAATRGHQGHLYPWGAAPRQSDELPALDPAVLARFMERTTESHYRLYSEHTVDCDVRDSVSGTAAMLQVFGNVREITSSLTPGPDVRALACGRCWFDPAARCTLADVWSYPLDTFSFMHGFRCAKSAAPPVD